MNQQSPPLTPRLLRILEMAASGMTRRQIATTLNRSHRTIARQRAQIIEKLGADNITQAVAMALRRRLIQ